MEVVNNNDQQNQPQVNVFPTPNYSEEDHQSHEATYDSGDHDHEAFSNPNSFTTSAPAPNMNHHNINNNETVVINNNNNLSHCAVCKCHCNDDENYLGSFPPGYRFVPFDDELVVHYLRRKVLGQPLPQNKIREVDLYRHDPHTLTEQYQGLGEKEWYFFTPRNRKYRNGTRPNRAAGNGYWKATGADKPINHKGIKVGSRKALVYYEGKAPDGKKTSWIMHEYRVEDPPRSARRGANDMRLDDWVLCRVYKKCDKFVKVHQREEARPEAIVSSTTTFSDEVSYLPPGINGNGPPEPNFIGETDDHELVNNYQENVQPPFQNGFLYGISQYTDDNSLVKFAKFNNNLMMSSHHNYGEAGGGGRPVPVPIMRPPVVYSNSENTLRPLYPKEETTTAFYPKQETVWGTNVPRGYQGDNISNGDELIWFKCHFGLNDDQIPNACNLDSIMQPYMNPTTNSSQMSPEE